MGLAAILAGVAIGLLVLYIGVRIDDWLVARGDERHRVEQEALAIQAEGRKAGLGFAVGS